VTRDTKTRAADQRGAVDLLLIKPILDAHIAKADDKAKKRFSRSPSLLAAAVADEAQKTGIITTREQWRGIYYPLKEQVVPQLFPRV
jgi:hypothetical protein